MSAFDRFRSSPGTDTLASFFRSLATPLRSYASSSNSPSPTPSEYEWDQLRSAQGGRSLHLEFFDASLSGALGADVVLKAIKQVPLATSITLAHNEIGDDGLRAFLAGLKQLRGKGVGNRLTELNLTGNKLSDTSLHLIALHLLSPSPHPPTLTHLYVTANLFSLGSSTNSTVLADFLGAAISSPTSKLRCLSLTNNKAIGSAGFVSLLRALKLSNGSSLSQLHLSVCSLTPDCVLPLARWLEDPEGGALSLQVLCLNGNKLSGPGLKRIARAITSKKCSGLIHLEAFANDDDIGAEWDSVVQELEEEEKLAEEEEKKGKQGGDEDAETSWRDKMEEAKSQNKRVFRETRLAALGMLAKTRVIFAGNPREPDFDASSIRKDVERLGLVGNTQTTNPIKPFPFLRLPIELQVHVLRCSLLLRPSSDAHTYPPLFNSTTATPITLTGPSTPIFSSPLTESQFLQVLEHGAHRLTLHTEARLANGARSAATTGSAPFVESTFGGRRGSADEEGWEQWMLAETGCDRFDR